jgi:hypothetical protein
MEILLRSKRRGTPSLEKGNEVCDNVEWNNAYAHVWSCFDVNGSPPPTQLLYTSSDASCWGLGDLIHKWYTEKKTFGIYSTKLLTSVECVSV